ncbi:MAG: hypothetical protein ACREQW_04975 [Candidatus Binatia bacterium]
MKTPAEKSIAGILGLFLGAILLFGFIQVSSVVLQKLCAVTDQVKLMGR